MKWKVSWISVLFFPKDFCKHTCAQLASASASTAVTLAVKAVIVAGSTVLVVVPPVLAISKAVTLALRSSKVFSNSSINPVANWKTRPPTPMMPKTMDKTRYWNSKGTYEANILHSRMCCTGESLTRRLSHSRITRVCRSWKNWN